MTVLHVIPDLKQASGPTAFCVEVCDRLADQETHVLILHGGTLSAESCVPKNPCVQLIREWPAGDSGKRPDLVHIHSLWAPFSHRAALWARRSAIPYVLSAHGMLAPWALRHKWLKKRLAWLLYQRRDLMGAAMFHVTAESEIGWLRGLGFRQPCALVPLGAELPAVDLEQERRRGDRKTVLFVGRIYPVKGLVNLIRAFAAVTRARCGAPWMLVLAGPDQAGHKRELITLGRQLGLTIQDCSSAEDAAKLEGVRRSDSDVIFTGAVYGDAKDSIYRAADLFVLPSFTENFGAVVADALSYGIPVITTKGTPWAELQGVSEEARRETCESLAGGAEQGCDRGREQPAAENERVGGGGPNSAREPLGRCGWWVDIGVEPLAAALREAMDMPEDERRAMGRRGRTLVETKYAWSAIAQRMRSAYAQLCGFR